METWQYETLLNSLLSRYVHVLVQKMAVNADLGFLLAVVTFFSKGQSNPQLEVHAHT